jgi:hypothetical protein
VYLFNGVGPGGGIDDGEDDEEHVTVGVGEGAEAVVLFLAGGVPEAEVDHAAVDLDGCGVVVENGGDVVGGELVLGVAGWEREYLMRVQVLPTAPSPTTTSFIDVGSYIMYLWLGLD